MSRLSIFCYRRSLLDACVCFIFANCCSCYLLASIKAWWCKVQTTSQSTHAYYREPSPSSVVTNCKSFSGLNNTNLDISHC
jgi:hypothetical protein